MCPADAPTPEKPARRKRRWFQFGLRTLLVLTTIVAVLFAGWSHKARQQREAVASLRVAGGGVIYDYRAHGLEQPPNLPAWLLKALGVDYFASAQGVYLGDSEITADGLKDLKFLTSLQYLDLQRTQITDAGLQYLAKLSTLEGIHLGGTQVTDAGLGHLKSLTALQSLDLGYTRVTDAGLEHLKEMTTLRRIYLWETKVTDAGVERLQGALPNCTIER